VRTTIDIPESLLDEAVRTSHSRTRREAVIAGLEELVRKARREELRQLAGKVHLELDPLRSRKSRPRS
jgi:Arc/MetJ family transcription regulator